MPADDIARAARKFAEDSPGRYVERDGSLIWEPLEDNAPAPSSERPLSLQEAADLIGLARKSCYRIAAEPAAPFYKLRGRWMVDRDDLLEWRAREVGAEPPARTSPRRGTRRPKSGGLREIASE